MNESINLENYSDLIDKIVVSYNKGMVLDFITTHSFQIIDESMKNLQEKFNTILSGFEEIQKESSSSAENTSHVETILSQIIDNRQKLQREIHKRVGEIDEAAQNAQNTASAFETLKEKTSEVEEMLAGIQDVSVKTGILAINASIEAARAGKVGSGFRIIANEVRTLATQTGDFTKKIEAKLEELQDSVSEINRNMSGFIRLFSKFQKSFNGVLNNFDQNSITINEANDLLTEIIASIKEQDVTIHQGFDSLKKIDEFLRNTSTILDVVQASHSHLGTLLQKNS